MSGTPQPRADVRVVVVSWNSRATLSDCLRSIASTDLAVEAWLVDNASADGSADVVARDFPAVHLIRNGENVGFARACNQALRQADARYYCLLNPDARLEPGALAVLVRFMEEHPSAGACGPALAHADGSLQPNGGPLPSLLGSFLYAMRLRNLNPAGYDRRFRWGREDFTADARVGQVSGACLLVRAEAVRQVGLMDERFFLYYEEVDWCARFQQAGWEVWYVPEARVLHHWGHSTGQTGFGSVRHLCRSQYQYFAKHRPLWLRPLAWLVTRLELASHWLAFRRRSP